MALARPITKAAEGLGGRRKNGLLVPYFDPVGWPTQGYGRRVASMENPEITVAEAEEWLTEDLTTAAQATLRLVPTVRSAGQLAALTDFVFNLGARRLAASRVRRLTLAKDYDAVPAALRQWRYARDTRTGMFRVLPGLVARREAEIKLWETQDVRYGPKHN